MLSRKVGFHDELIESDILDSILAVDMVLEVQDVYGCMIPPTDVATVLKTPADPPVILKRTVKASSSDGSGTHSRAHHSLSLLDTIHTNETHRFYYFSYTLGVLSVRETKQANIMKTIMVRSALSQRSLRL